jgi:hypothetical protein
MTGRGWSLHMSSKIRHTSMRRQAQSQSLMRSHPMSLGHYSTSRHDGLLFSWRCSAFPTLHIRHNSLDRASAPSRASSGSSPPLCDQVPQAEQIRRTTKGASGGDQHIGVLLADICPRHWDRCQDASAVVVEDAALAPRVFDGDELEGPARQRMEGVGDAEDLLRQCTINRS